MISNKLTLIHEKHFSQTELLALVNAKHPKQAMLLMGNCFALLFTWYHASLDNRNLVSELNLVCSILKNNLFLKVGHLEIIETINALQFEKVDQSFKHSCVSNSENASSAGEALDEVRNIRKGPDPYKFIKRNFLPRKKRFSYSVFDEYLDFINVPLRIDPSRSKNFQSLPFDAATNIGSLMTIIISQPSIGYHTIGLTCTTNSLQQLQFKLFDPNFKLITTSSPIAIEQTLSSLVQTYYSNWQITHLYSSKPYEWMDGLCYRLNLESYLAYKHFSLASAKQTLFAISDRIPDSKTQTKLEKFSPS